MSSRIYLTQHAFERIQDQDILETDVGQGLHAGIVIESYPDDTPYPSRLICACVKGRYLHIVAAYVSMDDVEIIITCYEPDPVKWDEKFLKRKRLI